MSRSQAAFAIRSWFLLMWSARPPSRSVTQVGSVAIRTITIASTRSTLRNPLAFLIETQPDAFDGLNLSEDGPSRRKFLARLQGEISKRGVIDVLRKGIKDGPHHVELFYGTPSPAKNSTDAGV